VKCNNVIASSLNRSQNSSPEAMGVSSDNQSLGARPLFVDFCSKGVDPSLGYSHGLWTF